MNETAQFLKGAITKINQAVADHREGLVRIDREFNAACDRIDQTITGLPRDTAPHGPASAHAQNKALIAQRLLYLEDEKKQANANREKRKANWLSAFVSEWQKTANDIEKAGARLTRQQPAFENLSLAPAQAAPGIPAALFLGSQRISLGNLSCLVPHALAFPFAQALVFPENNAMQRHLAHQLLLRLLCVLPPGQLELTLIDPLKLGQSVEPFLPLLKVAQLVPQRRVLTRSDDIEAILDQLTSEVEDLIQHRFNGKAADWSAYNAARADHPLSYKVVLLFDVPEQLSDKSLWFLQRLCEHGPRCGVLPLIATDGPRLEDRRYQTFRAALDLSARPLHALMQGPDAGSGSLSFAYQPETWPRQPTLDAFLAALAARCAAKALFTHSMLDLWANFAPGETTVQGFDVPIGWTPAGDSVPLVLGATASEHHALLAGKTGSGKSNLLHVIIHGLCEKYAPAELDLYLLDYKESTEFNVYANPPLPHARLVATESDPEYGVAVLRHLVDELEQRARIFKAAGVRDFAEYRHASRQRLPRVLLLIDEFQVLFSERRQIADAAEQLLSQLLKQGRSFGIHILLATQTLKGISALSISALITQLGCRIALACGQEDSAMILGANNWAAAELHSPPEGIINNANGAKSGNVKFLIPLAENTFSRQHIEQLSQRAAQRGGAPKTRIFSGGHLPALPSCAEFQALGRPADALLLGERLTFEADALSVQLPRRAAFNVLFSGYNDQIHDGLLAATLSSIAYAGNFDEVVYFNGRGIAPGAALTAAAQPLGSRFKAFDDVAVLPLQEILDGINTRRVALVIDGLDSEKALHPSPAFRPPKPNEPPSSAELFKRIVEEGSRKGTFVFAFIDQWRRCAGPCKDILSFFELRVAYCMNEDDAGALVSGGIGKFKGIEKPNRAVFVNRMTNDNVWFRPYI